MAKKNNYWRRREQKHIKERIKYDKEINKRIANNYRGAMNDIDEQIAAFVGRYADKEGITIEQAKKRASKLDIEKYKKKAKKYVKEKDFSALANEEMRKYNLSMRINRLELLKEDIRLELIAMTSEEEKLMYEALNKGVIDEYKRQASILGDTIHYNAKQVQSIVNSSFLTATWSDRIWSNHGALRAEMDKLINRGIIQELNPRELARDLRKTFETSVYNSERIMRTEMARAQTEVFEDSAEQMGITQYTLVSEPDACDICSSLDDGEPIDIKDMKIGENASPVHPNCRCANAMYFDEEVWEEEMQRLGL